MATRGRFCGDDMVVVVEDVFLLIVKLPMKRLEPVQVASPLHHQPTSFLRMPFSLGLGSSTDHRRLRLSSNMTGDV